MSMKLLLLSLTLSLLVMLLGLIFSKKMESDRELQSPFECGCAMTGESRIQFSLHFYLVALVFIIFDVELILLFPFFLSFMFAQPIMLMIMFFVILIVLTYGLLSEWNQMILEWMV